MAHTGKINGAVFTCDICWNTDLDNLELCIRLNWRPRPPAHLLLPAYSKQGGPPHKPKSFQMFIFIVFKQGGPPPKSLFKCSVSYFPIFMQQILLPLPSQHLHLHFDKSESETIRLVQINWRPLSSLFDIVHIWFFWSKPAGWPPIRRLLYPQHQRLLYFFH